VEGNFKNSLDGLVALTVSSSSSESDSVSEPELSSSESSPTGGSSFYIFNR